MNRCILESRMPFGIHSARVSGDGDTTPREIRAESDGGIRESDFTAG